MRGATRLIYFCNLVRWYFFISTRLFHNFVAHVHRRVNDNVGKVRICNERLPTLPRGFKLIQWMLAHSCWWWDSEWVRRWKDVPAAYIAAAEPAYLQPQPLSTENGNDTQKKTLMPTLLNGDVDNKSDGRRCRAELPSARKYQWLTFVIWMKSSLKSIGHCLRYKWVDGF